MLEVSTFPPLSDHLFFATNRRRRGPKCKVASTINSSRKLPLGGEPLRVLEENRRS